MRTRVAAVTVLAVVLVSGMLYLALRIDSAAALAPGLIETRGVIEAERHPLAAPISGTIAEVTVNEGDAVSAGALLIRFDDAEAVARLADAQSDLRELGLRLGSIQAEVAALDSTMARALAAATEEEGLAASALERSRAEAEARRQEADALASIVDPDEATAAERDRAETAARAAEAAEAAASRRHDRAVQLLDIARYDEQRLAEARGAVLQAERDIEEAEHVRRDAAAAAAIMAVYSPSSGVVRSLGARPGERVGIGAPLCEIVNGDVLFLRGLMPAAEAASITPGSPARVLLADRGGEALDATVRWVARVGQGFVGEMHEARIVLDQNPGGRAAPGAVAVAVIRWKPDAPWPEAFR